MRALWFLPVFLVVAACSGPDAARKRSDDVARHDPALTGGEQRVRIAPRGQPAATLRSGPQVPVVLPRGFTLYPGAAVTSNTMVERAGKRHVLLLFTTSDPVGAVLAFYRNQAKAAGLTPTLDVGGDQAASIGGDLDSDAAWAVSAQKHGAMTRVEFSFE